ncbi:ABC transporter ATP-binding protein [Leucobacter chinensis]|uniref:ABC transporter ATP-binding protein n=1 Tax=Leucobacter chinensis TaxID=2851010 RepID=UPI001C2465CA|nr:ABC transporter ATP-binding protein [Leucobacter chinensis]
MLRLLFRFADQHARRRLALYLTVTVAATLSIAGLLVSLVPLVGYLFSGDTDAALRTLGVVACFGVATAVLEFFGTVLGQRAGATLILRMHQVIGERVMRLPLGWFDTERAGALSHLTARGVTFAANAPESILRAVLQAVIAPLCVGLAMFAVDVPVAITMVVGILVVVIVWALTRSRGQQLERAADVIQQEGASRVLEFATAQPAVRAAGPDSLAERGVRRALTDQRVMTERTLRGRTRSMALYSALAYLAMFAVVTVSVMRVMSGELEASMGIALIMLQIIMTWFANHGLPFGEGLDLALRTLTEIDDLLEQPLLSEPAEAKAARDSSVELDRVTFGYSRDTPVIRDASFKVAAGSMTAIVGPSGSGKTTIARLIARFYDVDSGAIRIGGHDVRELGTQAALANVSMVFQDVYLFEDTLRENIRLGNAQASDAEVEAVAARAGVTEIAERLPHGFDTRVGEGGGTLSGGERQRVSIARALLKDAPIVLLDEATAALDIESERLIQRGLTELTGQKTLIVIAHRLQTIRQADQIVVLTERGEIEAVGSHERLLETSPTYAGFWRERESSQSWRIDAAS